MPADQPATAMPAPGRHWTARAGHLWDRLSCSTEVDADPRLKIICGSLLLYFHMTFAAWREQAASLSTLGVELFDYVPAPFLQDARGLIFLDLFQTRTWLYLQGLLALFGLLSLLYLRTSRVALALLAWLWINKVYFYLADFRLFANFHHFHLFYTLVFLVASDKLRMFRSALAVSYVLSGLVKLTPSWIFGEYFNSVPGKLPLLPANEGVVTAASVAVILLEFLGPLCWCTRRSWLRRLSFGAFLVFHLYSGVIVGFWYTTLMLPLVAAAFLGFTEPLQAGYRFVPRHAGVFAIFGVVLLGGLRHYFIPGDVRLTAEGRYTGLFMFDANLSVQFQAVIEKGDQLWILRVNRSRLSGSDNGIRCLYYRDDRLTANFEVTRPLLDEGQIIFNPDYFTGARTRIAGDPYLYYFYARELVRRYQPDRLSIRLDEQLDGHPEFATLINIPDFAALNPTYRCFSRNEWILLPGPEAPGAYRWP